MNEKFFSLPQEKQQAIINAGYRVFSQNCYKKSPMSEIADAAGISKALLFHYFHNKKELYLFLWEECSRTTLQALAESGCAEQTDLFQMMLLGLNAKVKLMRKYPHLGAFSLKAFYEKDPTVCPEIQASAAKYAKLKTNPQALKMDHAQFRQGVDLGMMYRDMYLATEGYLWEKMQQDDFSVEDMESDFVRLIDFWKTIYLRNEGAV